MSAMIIDYGQLVEFERALHLMALGLRAISCDLCIDCLENHDRCRVATEDLDLCSDCYSDRTESAYESQCREFYGGGSPQTDAERAEVARRDGVR